MNEHGTTSDSGLLEQRIAAWLRAEAPAHAPTGFLAGAVAALDPGRRPTVRGRLVGLVRAPELLGVVLVGVLAAMLIGGIALLPGSVSRPTAGAGGAPSYDGIQFRADGLLIDVPGGQFILDPTTAQVSSDPGSSAYRTLEFTWRQSGVEMRLSLYFASDGTSWSVSEIRTYDGRANGKWVTYRPGWQLPLGVAFDGPVNLTGAADRGGAGTLRIARLVLLPTFPRAINAATTGPTSGPNGDISPFAAGQLLNCVGAETMTPQQLALYARSHGYATGWRYQVTGGNGGTGTSEDREPPPGSVLIGAAWGMSGELLVFAAPADDLLSRQEKLSAQKACPPAGAPAK